MLSLAYKNLPPISKPLCWIDNHSVKILALFRYEMDKEGENPLLDALSIESREGRGWG